MSAEEWRTVADYPSYQISSLGRVLSTSRQRGFDRTPHFLRPGYTTAGYPTVVLYRCGGRRTQYIHHLVAEAFIGPRPEGLEIRHLDGDPANCVVANLAYGTQSENNFDRVRHGTHHLAAKTHCLRGHLYDADNTYRRPSRPSSRYCRACKRARYANRAFRAASVRAAA